MGGEVPSSGVQCYVRLGGVHGKRWLVEKSSAKRKKEERDTIIAVKPRPVQSSLFIVLHLS